MLDIEVERSYVIQSIVERNQLLIETILTMGIEMTNEKKNKTG